MCVYTSLPKLCVHQPSYAVCTPAFLTSVCTPAFLSSVYSPAFLSSVCTPAFLSSVCTPAFLSSVCTPAFISCVYTSLPKAGHRSTLRPCVRRFWHRASDYVRLFPSCLCGDVILTCVCRRLREQCLRSKITSVARVEIVLLLRFVAGNVDVNTLASKCSELLGNADILRMRRVIHNDSTCLCLRIPVAAIMQERKRRPVAGLSCVYTSLPMLCVHQPS